MELLYEKINSYLVINRPENLLLNMNYELKVADFGLGNIVESRDDPQHDNCGTAAFAAPGSKVKYMEYLFVSFFDI